MLTTYWQLSEVSNIKVFQLDARSLPELLTALAQITPDYSINHIDIAETNDGVRWFWRAMIYTNTP